MSNHFKPMDDSQRLQLQSMISAAGSDMVDQTQLIRELKHSHIMEEEINKMLVLRDQIADATQLWETAAAECTFLFTYYTDIFNKLRKNEIDVGLLRQFLMVLRRIEQGEMDQHEGSFAVGTILKELYVDSMLKKADKLNESEEGNEETAPAAAASTPKEPVKVSWQEFKRQQKIFSIVPEEQERQLVLQRQQEKKQEKRKRHKEAKKNGAKSV